MRKKKRDPYHIMIDDVVLIQTNVGRGSRVDTLPTVAKFNPRKVHVARRRAYKEHHAFPRGWTLENTDTGDINVIGLGAAAAIVKNVGGIS